MNATAIVVEGWVQPDGTLEVTQKISLPAGPVHVTVHAITEPVQSDQFLNVSESIWTDRRAGGQSLGTQAEIDAGVRAWRDEVEEELQAVERLHDECRRARQQAQLPNE